MADLGFPINIVDCLIDSLKQSLTEHVIIDRPLRYADPSRSVGVYAVDVQPDNQNSALIGQIEPALNKYIIRIQNFVKASDEQLGRKLFAYDSKVIRVILYRDSNLRVRLQALTEDLLGSRETFKRFSISRQRFLNNELKSQFLYLAMTDLSVDTEVVQL